MKTTVVNLRKEPYDVYIGRPGRGEAGLFGNPFWKSDESGRDEAIAKFEVYFLDRVESDPAYRAAVLALKGLRLGCFCAPKHCHGDVIARWLDCDSQGEKP